MRTPSSYRSVPSATADRIHAKTSIERESCMAIIMLLQQRRQQQKPVSREHIAVSGAREPQVISLVKLTRAYSTGISPNNALHRHATIAGEHRTSYGA